MKTTSFVLQWQSSFVVVQFFFKTSGIKKVSFWNQYENEGFEIAIALHTYTH